MIGVFKDFTIGLWEKLIQIHTKILNLLNIDIELPHSNNNRTTAEDVYVEFFSKTSCTRLEMTATIFLYSANQLSVTY